MWNNTKLPILGAYANKLGLQQQNRHRKYKTTLRDGKPPPEQQIPRNSYNWTCPRGKNSVSNSWVRVVIRIRTDMKRFVARDIPCALNTFITIHRQLLELSTTFVHLPLHYPHSNPNHQQNLITCCQRHITSHHIPTKTSSKFVRNCLGCPDDDCQSNTLRQNIITFLSEVINSH